MALFKKMKKKTDKQKYFEFVMEKIGFESAKGKNAIFVSAEGEQEDWLTEFCEQRGYEVRASHTTNNVNYYKVWGWGNEFY